MKDVNLKSVADKVAILDAAKNIKGCAHVAGVGAVLFNHLYVLEQTEPSQVIFASPESIKGVYDTHAGRTFNPGDVFNLNVGYAFKVE